MKKLMYMVGYYMCMLYSGGENIAYMGGIYSSAANLTKNYPSGYGGMNTSYMLGFKSSINETQGCTLSGTWRHD